MNCFNQESTLGLCANGVVGSTWTWRLECVVALVDHPGLTTQPKLRQPQLDRLPNVQNQEETPPMVGYWFFIRLHLRPYADTPPVLIFVQRRQFTGIYIYIYCDVSACWEP